MLRLLFVFCTPCSLATEMVGVTSTGASFAASLDSPLRQDELDADQVEGRQLFLAHGDDGDDQRRPAGVGDRVDASGSG